MWTVIGYFESTGQAFCDHVRASDAIQAMWVSASSARPESDLFIVGAIAGRHQLVTACEESGAVAAADDLI